MRLVLALSIVASAFQALAAPSDPCATIAGKPYVSPTDVLTCYNSFPFNRTLQNNVVTNSARVLDFFTFEDYYYKSPAPFQESTVNIRGELARINATKYKNDYEFNKDLFFFSVRLNDGHTRWYPDCYTAFQTILPAPVISLDVNGTQSLYVAPDSVEFLSLLGSNFTDYFDSIKFDWKRLAGAKVLEIGGKPAYDYVDQIASTVSSNFLDHGIRVNSVYSGYRISGGYSQKLGDLAGQSMPIATSVPFKLILSGSKKAEIIEIPYTANFIGNAFTDKSSYWTNNCAARADTNGQDASGASQKMPPAVKRMRASEPQARFAAAVIPLPERYVPTLTTVGGNEGVIRSYILPGSKTGVIFVGSFGGDFDGFMTDIVSAVDAFKAAGVTQLIVDVTNNGGGYVCLGHYLHRYLAGASVGYSGFVSTARANPLAKKIVAQDIKLGLDSTQFFYPADNWAFLNDTRMPSTYDYMTPSETVIINGREDETSQRFHDTCELSFLQPLPEEPPFELKNVKIVTNGFCASTCAMWTTLMYERHETEIAVFGGRPGQPIEYKGMAGNQVLEWPDLATEIKSAGLGDDPLAPPDLLIAGNFRVNWRTAWSWLDEKIPIAYKSERPQRRFAYTNATYNNPQNLWLFAEGEFFGK